MKVGEYRGKRSVLINQGLDAQSMFRSKTTGGTLGSYRMGLGFTKARTAAMSELSDHLMASGIKVAAGPVLSGCLMAQELSTASKGKIKAVFLPKVGYGTNKHGGMFYIRDPWVWVDDLICSGSELYHSYSIVRNRGIKLAPGAIIVFSSSMPCDPPKEWGDVPMFVLRARRRAR